MNFFDFFRPRKRPAQNEPAKVLLPDGRSVSPRLAALLPQLEPLALPALHIRARASDDLFLFDSKFGGYPYWPAGKPYPVDGYGQYMYLLAQLNFSQIPRFEGFPAAGLLQFYLSADDMYGLNYENPTGQVNFRVVYFADTKATALENFHFLDRQQPEGALPVSRQLQLEFSPARDYHSFSDVRFPQDLADELMAGDQPEKGQLPLEEELSELYPETGHKMGGYAFFTQDDPRQGEAYRDYILLLQIDSQGNDFCWGDAGVGNFFIHPDDLKRKDFSRVLYNWDCT